MVPLYFFGQVYTIAIKISIVQCTSSSYLACMYPSVLRAILACCLCGMTEKEDICMVNMVCNVCVQGSSKKESVNVNC